MGVRAPHGSQHGSVDGENLTALPPLEEELQMKTEDFLERKNKDECPERLSQVGIPKHTYMQTTLNRLSRSVCVCLIMYLFILLVKGYFQP